MTNDLKKAELAAHAYDGLGACMSGADRLAALSHPEPVAQEAGWLIELRGSRPTWWSLHPDEEPGWLLDANKALRFARKEDAEAYINDAGWNDAFATEHKWM